MRLRLSPRGWSSQASRVCVISPSAWLSPSRCASLSTKSSQAQFCYHVTAITHRKDAVYPATIVGIPPMEDFYIGSASVKLFLPIFKMNFPEIVDLALPAEGVFHNLVFVSMKKTYPMQAYKSPCGRPPCTASGAWGR